MKKTTPKKNITINLRLAGQDKSLKASSVLEGLRALEIDILKIKSVGSLEVSFEDREFRKVFRIPLLKKLVMNDIYRQIIAKIFNLALGITQ